MDHASLLDVLHYDPDTGIFTWKNCRCARGLNGTRAGSVNGKGYRQIKVLGGTYREHRLAFFYMTGAWPENLLDHKNRIRSDNRWINIRPADEGQNQQNAVTKKSLPGAYKTNNPNRPWRGLITANKQRHHLGYFKTEKLAHEAYAEAKARLHTHHFSA